jgi:hypothetical protein
MKYCIVTSQGFQMNGDEAAVYDSQREAMDHMGPGDQMVPIVPSENVVKFTKRDDE